MTKPTPTEDKTPATVEETETATASKKKTKNKKKKKTDRDASGRRASDVFQPFLRRRNRKNGQDRADTSIPFSDIQEELDKIPVTKTGEIHEDDLEKFAERIVRQRKSTGRQRRFFFGSLGFSGVLLLALFGLIILAITVSKDTSVNKAGALVANNKEETPITIHGNNGIRIHADTTPLHSVPLRRARRALRRMLSEEDEFGDGDTVALVHKSDVEESFDEVVNNDNGVHVHFNYLGSDYAIKLGTDAMILKPDDGGYTLENIHIEDYEEGHQVRVICQDGADDCDVVTGSETTNEFVRRLFVDHRRKLSDDPHFNAETAECYDCGPDKGTFGLCSLENSEDCSFCECVHMNQCKYNVASEMTYQYKNYGRDSRGDTAEEREEICKTEMLPSDPQVLEERWDYLRYDLIWSFGNRCNYCRCGNFLCNESCFSPDSSVQTKDRGAVLMKELQLGDSVLTSSGRYKKVQAFQTHKLPALYEKAQYLKIVTDVGNEIVMTPRHMIFRCEDRSHPVPASKVREGDCLVVVQQGDDNNNNNNEAANQSIGFRSDEEIEATVVHVEQLGVSGGFSPLTEDGTIVVDGIVASCYSNPEGEQDAYVRVFGVTTPIHRHTLTHALATPVLHFCDRISSVPCAGFSDGSDPATLPPKMPIDVWFTYFHRRGFTHFFFAMVVLVLLRAVLGGAGNTSK